MIKKNIILKILEAKVHGIPNLLSNDVGITVYIEYYKINGSKISI